MTTNSTISDLERRVEDAIVRVLGEHRTWYGPLFVNEVARAALKAHAEWLEEQGLVVVPAEPTETMIAALNGGSLPFGFSTKIVQQESVGIWQAMIAAAQQEDQHHD